MNSNPEIDKRLARAWNEVMGRSQRKRISEVWQKSKEEEDFSAEEERLARILQDHEEYESIWERTPPQAEEETGGVNPYLHVCLHLVIENQIAEGNPRQVSRYLSRKLSQGEDRHKVIHELASIFSEFLLNTLKYQRPFNRGKYIQKLVDLSREIEG